jgi:hypothetical protein
MDKVRKPSNSVLQGRFTFHNNRSLIRVTTIDPVRSETRLLINYYVLLLFFEENEFLQNTNPPVRAVVVSQDEGNTAHSSLYILTLCWTPTPVSLMIKMSVMLVYGRLMTSHVRDNLYMHTHWCTGEQPDISLWRCQHKLRATVSGLRWSNSLTTGGGRAGEDILHSSQSWNAVLEMGRLLRRSRAAPCLSTALVGEIPLCLKSLVFVGLLLQKQACVSIARSCDLVREVRFYSTNANARRSFYESSFVFRRLRVRFHQTGSPWRSVFIVLLSPVSGPWNIT